MNRNTLQQRSNGPWVVSLSLAGSRSISLLSSELFSDGGVTHIYMLETAGNAGKISCGNRSAQVNTRQFGSRLRVLRTTERNARSETKTETGQGAGGG